ncbi:putative RNA pseudouridine synthase [Halomicronema hongdechloris C2206]|uniref:RNA pseudouridine synthase n=1 Tax=Halomicronema hongdechloris C2206 TaxID=1641165 RepID=A0A1Z3HU37_9CYAN|nr:hypothetical protein [Halomicronema hongdechloris]ASC73809.1 putative RNA pseudouridine synthase [Halomicronema hongdechloris C2206]
MNQGWTYHERVPADAVGQSLLDYYSQRYRHSSPAQWQTRIQLAAAGYPLLGDPLYLPGGHPRLTTAADTLPVPGDVGYHLHAHYLRCRHPNGEQWLNLVCPAPAALA